MTEVCYDSPCQFPILDAYIAIVVPYWPLLHKGLVEERGVYVKVEFAGAQDELEACIDG